ncbi:MAG: preprotein translocase subunit SecE [Clostridia bacterium]|nr:preprotein translocase subunit SecE [Clostridia bacterium]
MKKDKNATTGDFIEVDKSAAKQKDVKDVKKTKKNKKPNIFVRLGRKLKDVFSELKRVNWPTFPKIVKQTGIVLAVVLVFLIVITAFDFGLMELLKLVAPRSV